MLDTISFDNKKALARVALGIFGISNGGRIRTNEPDIYNMFVDFFYVTTQEEIMPILQDIIGISQQSTITVATQLSNREKDEFRQYMLARIGGDNRKMLALAMFLKNIGFNASYF